MVWVINKYLSFHSLLSKRRLSEVHTTRQAIGSVTKVSQSRFPNTCPPLHSKASCFPSLSVTYQELDHLNKSVRSWPTLSRQILLSEKIHEHLILILQKSLYQDARIFSMVFSPSRMDQGYIYHISQSYPLQKSEWIQVWDSPLFRIFSSVTCYQLSEVDSVFAQSLLHSHKLATHWDSTETSKIYYIWDTRCHVWNSNISQCQQPLIICPALPTLTVILTYLRRGSAELPLRSNREIPTTKQRSKKCRVMIDLKGLQSYNSQLHDAFHPKTSLALFSDESKCARVCHGNVR